MKIFELTTEGYGIEDMPQIVFDESNVFICQKKDNELKLLYDVASDFLFPVSQSWFSILTQDIHNEIPCGTLFVQVPVRDSFDTIIYIVRFEENEFEKIKNFFLTKCRM